jgi:ribonucleoside-diphosphate reductase alpha chain
MMIAVQPFLSGGISKTVNLPQDGHGGRHRADLHAGLERRPEVRGGLPQTTASCRSPSRRTPARPTASKKKLAWGERKKMPALRDAKTMKINLGGTELYITPGFFEDGTLGEIFVRVAKQGSTLNGIIDAWATAFSIGLQHGVPLETSHREEHRPGVPAERLHGPRRHPAGAVDRRPGGAVAGARVRTRCSSPPTAP